MQHSMHVRAGWDGFAVLLANSGGREREPQADRGPAWLEL